MGTLLRVGAIALLLPTFAPAAQPRTPSEREVKSAYLYNFARFVEWPHRTASASTPFVVCVIGTDPLGTVLDTTLADVTVRGAKAVVRRVTATDEVRACHVLFVAASEESNLGALLAGLGATDVLTVSDMPRFITRGGMIQFVNDSGRVRFEIGLGSVQHAGLRMSSDLLRVARTVIRTTPDGGSL